jgi:hypothetical protein
MSAGLLSESSEGKGLLVSQEEWRQQAREDLFRDDKPDYSGIGNSQPYSPPTTIELMEQELSDWLCDWDQ